MKKVLLIAALVALMASPAFAVISGSAHDFSSTGSSGFITAPANDEICVVCHAPHNNSTAAAAVTGGLLWNRGVTGSTFSMYTSNTLDNTIASAPSNASVLCLSCHDGTIAVDSYGSLTGTTNLASGDAAFLDTDLKNDHPISVEYSVAADAGLHATTDGVINGGTLTVADLLAPGAGLPTVECSSCHDVHNQGAGTTKLLVTDNNNSDLCLSCHIK